MLGTELFTIFYDDESSFVLFKLDYSFNSDDEITFSDLIVSEPTELSFTDLSPASISFTDKTGNSNIDYTPNNKDNKGLATTSRYGKPDFVTFNEDILTLCYDNTSFPY